MTTVVALTGEGSHELAPGVRMFPLFGEAAMLNVVDLDPNAVVPLHRHPHEQLGLVLAGEITMTIDGADYLCRPNDAYVIPGDVEHGARAGREGCRVIDVFVPVREDYRALVAAAGSPTPDA
jgi:quercetin dioxygenase-like cupin family protein